MTVTWRLLCVSAATVTLFCQALAGTNEEGLKFLEENAKKPGVIVLDSGLQYKVLREGSGTDHPTADSSCECHYAGTLIDGTTFDSSYDRGSPTSFAPNQVIKGWTEAMQLMVEGDLWEMYIPSELGYGDRGSPPKIGGGDVLIFQMEIIKINGDKLPAIRCNPFTKEGCNEKEVAYLTKIKDKHGDDVGQLKQQAERLEHLQGGKMKSELQNWIKRRLSILNKLIKGAPSEKEL